MYYGNGSVGPAADGAGVFELFDDFSAGALDTSKWEISGTTGTTTVSGGELAVANTTTTNYIVRSKAAFGTDTAVRARLKPASYDGTHFEYLAYSPGDGKAPGLIAMYNDTSSTYSHKYYANNGGTYTTSTITGWSVANTYLVQDIIRNSASSGIFKVNDANQVSIATNIYGGNDCKVQFYTYYSGSRLTADWVFVRKYAASEPTGAVQASSSSPYFAGSYTGNFAINGVTQTGNVTLTVRNGDIVQTRTILVDALDHFTITGAAAQAAGSTQTITLTAAGVSGSAFINYAGDKAVTFSGAGSVGAYAPTCTDKSGNAVAFGTPTMLTFTAGVATCSLVLYKAETALINVADGETTAAGHELSVAVTSTVSTFALSLPALTAGTPASVTLTAQDVYGNPATDYTGEHDITFGGATAQGAYGPTASDRLGTDVPFGTHASLTFQSGVANTVFKLYRAETVNLTASDGTFSASVSAQVGAGALASFGIGVPQSTKSGVPFAMTLDARDTYGNRATGITETTSVSVDHGTINGGSVPASEFQTFRAPDDQVYTYRRDLAVSNPAASSLTGYQLKLSVDTAALITAGKLQEDCDDLRFAETNGDNIPYRVESGCNTTSTIVWIKTNLPASSGKTVYMYYGNGGVASQASGSAVFEFFEDFTGSAVDTNKWTVGDATGITVGGGVLAVNNNSGKIVSVSAFTQPAVLDIRWKRTNTAPASGWNPGGFWTNTNNQLTLMDHGSYKYYRSDGSWVNASGLYPADTWLKTEYAAASSSSVNLRVTNYATGADVWNVGNVSNSISNDAIMIGRRGDDIAANQSGFGGQVDWVMVRRSTSRGSLWRGRRHVGTIARWLCSSDVPCEGRTPTRPALRWRFVVRGRISCGAAMTARMHWTGPRAAWW
jgi:hypothetical protein